MTRAAFIGQDGHAELKNVELPKLGPNSILVEMKASGICGTDLEKLSGGYTASAILGHEVSGVIKESASSDFQVGEKVVPHHHVACGKCFYCGKAAETMCQGFLSSNFLPGGFADEFMVSAYNVKGGGVHRFDGITFEEASFAEPLGCCIRGLEKATRSKLLPVEEKEEVHSRERTNYSGPLQLENALVVGAGPIGLLHMELLSRRFEDLKLACADISPTRLEFAEKFERAMPVMPASENGAFADSAKRLTDGLGYDLVVVATGSASAFSEAIRCVRKAGSLLLFGAARKGVTHPLDLQAMLLNELSLSASYATSETEISEALALLESGKIKVDKFVTARFPLENVDTAMQTARKEGQVKVLVTA